MGLHPSNKPATRHFDVRKHVCRQHVKLGNVTTPADMLADFLSKQTPKPTFLFVYNPIVLVCFQNSSLIIR